MKQLAIVSGDNYARDGYLTSQGWNVLHIDHCSVEVVIESLGLEPDEDEPEA